MHVSLLCKTDPVAGCYLRVGHLFCWVILNIVCVNGEFLYSESVYYLSDTDTVAGQLQWQWMRKGGGDMWDDVLVSLRVILILFYI